MAFLRTARASSIHFGVNADKWQKVRTASTSGGPISNLVEQASDILGDHLTPDRYLLSHATIVCSVDTEEPANVRLGSLTVDGNQIQRLYPDYRVTRLTEKFSNSNDDGWERKALLKSYKTFIGADNFVEHRQLPEESKGKIIDAVARDIGPSVYIDILIATDRRHSGLIKRIEGDKISTLSMGCILDFSVCSRCGHVSTDETNMCRHVRYEKGNSYSDEDGFVRRVIELCGHHSADPTAGVRFIEASWVEIPAFTGAVKRNIINPTELTTDTIRYAQQILSQPPREWTDGNLEKILKAASLMAITKVAAPKFDFGEDAEGADEKSKENESEKPLEESLNDVVRWLSQKAKERLKEEMEGSKEPSTATSPINPNENLIRTSRHEINEVYQAGLVRLARIAPSNSHLVRAIKRYNRAFGVKIPDYIYDAAVRLGADTKYFDLRSFLDKARRVLGREPNPAEAKTLVRIAKILSLRGRSEN